MPHHPNHGDRPDKPDRPKQSERSDRPQKEQRQDQRQERPDAQRPYRIEKTSPGGSSLLPEGSIREFYRDRGMAVAVAVKSLGDPTRQQVRVVHVPSGEVVFETEAPQRPRR